MTKVDLSHLSKDIRRLPIHVLKKLHFWVKLVEEFGIREVRKIPGYHDEPLQGDRRGERSIRLTKGYRAIYVERNSYQVDLLIIIEVNKHAY